MSLADQCILITGASSLPGRTLALALAERGATVILQDQRERQLNPLYDEIKQAYDIEALLLPLDLKKADGAALGAVTEAIMTQFNGLDGLLHCQHWSSPLRPFVHDQLDNWPQIMQHQVLIPLQLTQALLPALRAAPAASVVFSNLDIAAKARANWSGVGVMAAALRHSVDMLAQEHDDNSVRFNSVEMGKVNTNIRQKYYPGETPAERVAGDDPSLINAFLDYLDAADRRNGSHISVG